MLLLCRARGVSLHHKMVKLTKEDAKMEEESRAFLLEFDFSLFYQFFNFEYRVLHRVAPISKVSFHNLLIDPSDKLRQNANSQFHLYHFNPVRWYDLDCV
jgi:hypothetical protein